MILTLEQWKEILNSNESDILEQIKVKLKEQCKYMYQKWEQERFDINYQFDVLLPSIYTLFDIKFTLLHLAAFNGNTEALQALLKVEGIDVNEKNENGDTSLHLAAFNDYTKIAQALLKVEGINVNEKETNGWTPLHLAAFDGNTKIAQALLKVEGIDVNEKNENGDTPYDHYEIEKYLKGTGICEDAESSAWRKVPWTKTDSLVKNDFAQFVGFFTAHMVWQLEGGENVVPLIAIQNADERWYKRVYGDDLPYERAVAIARERLQSILSSSRGDYALLAYDGFLTLNNKRDESLFIEAHDIRDQEGITFVLAIPYRSAQSKEGLAIYRPVVTETANLSDINTFLYRCYEGAQNHTKGFEFWNAHMDTPLMKSNEQLFATITEGDIKQLQRLIEDGLCVNLADETGCTLAHHAAFCGKKEIVEFLCEKGANINAVDREQRTPLHYATSEDHEEMVKFLLEKGANINAADQRGGTMLHYAAGNSKKGLVKFLLKKGVNIDAEDQRGWTPLLHAVHQGNREMAEFLLQEEANICTVDKEGFTLLHSATSEGHEEMVKFLLTKGININAEDQDGWTPLHYAVHINDEVIVELLLKEGADINIVDKEGFTPLHYAIYNDYKEVIELLSMGSK
ncbi:ankyrin repeat domain-containing protein [Wolbachia endosymbiont (group A) of Bombylius major]|uniref:ankyrin repeat domain-containing protein n=1 Tax=Wolbachia endosymbiont (group A) of Bombylius major TaxID=2953988 RepID=UPI0022303E0E|nr:ankyrin repeat domain-containing protein [Wolbachia endosymbiont (group A) of Bombylius major]